MRVTLKKRDGLSVLPGSETASGAVMARTRSENYDEIKRGILSKAASLYSAHGYMRSSIADLADACQLSRGALYHYFSSKEAILYALLDAHLREMLGRIEDAKAGAPGDAREQLRLVVAAIVTLNAASPNEQRVLLNDMTFLGDTEQAALSQMEREIVGTMADLLLPLDQERKINRRTKTVYTMMMFGIINYTYTWYDPNGPITPDEFASMAVDLFLGGFTAKVDTAPQLRRLRRSG